MSKPITSSSRPRRGSVMLYSSVGLVAVCGFVSLAVDYGRVQVAKTEIQTAADMAARYAATGVKHEIDGVNAAPAMARAALADAKVDSKLLKDTQSTVEVGVWNESTRQFSAAASAAQANAVRVTLKCQPSDGSAIPTSFASVLGFTEQTLTARATALYQTSGSANSAYMQKYVPATSNLWLAGEDPGTSASNGNPHNNPDHAGASASSPGQSPVLMDGLRISPGSTLTFDGVNGGANNVASSVLYGGDGRTTEIVDNLTGTEHHKSNVLAPINSVIAVFLDDRKPHGQTPADLDFSTPESRDFQTLKPQLNQIFFIGDGRRDNGDLQQFVVPAAATRVFIGTMDSYEWNNNIGGFTVTATATAKIVLVK